MEMCQPGVRNTKGHVVHVSRLDYYRLCPELCTKAVFPEAAYVLDCCLCQAEAFQGS